MNIWIFYRLLLPAASSSAVRAVLILSLLLANRPAIAEDYILLHNGNVIQGTPHLLGTHVVIDRGDGSELRLDSRQVAYSATSLSELYQYRRQQCQYPTVSSYQEDARWCYRNELFAEMQESLDAADALDPTHPETLRLKRQLASVQSRSSGEIEIPGDSIKNTLTPTAGRVVISAAPPVVQRPPVEEASEAELMKANLTFQAVAYFNNRIQPLLINRCGNTGCHRSPSETKWQLTHMGVHVRPPSRMTKLNLLTTLSIVNRNGNGDALSDLMTYATTAHGGKDEAPLKRGDATSIESLQEWIHEVSSTTATDDATPLIELPALSSEIAQVTPPKPSGQSSVPKIAAVRQVGFTDTAMPFDPIDTLAKPKLANAIHRESGGTRPTRLPTVENPFDPEIFNRYYRSANASSDRDK